MPSPRKNFPPLTEAQRQQAADNIGLVHAACRHYFGRYKHTALWDDILGYGFIGLCRAVRGFEPEKGFQFATYAWPVIRTDVVRHLEYHQRTAMLPLLYRYDGSLVDDTGQWCPHRASADLTEYMRKALAACEAKSKTNNIAIVRRRMGFDGPPETLQQIANDLGMSKQCIHERWKAGLKALRKTLERMDRDAECRPLKAEAESRTEGVSTPTAEEAESRPSKSRSRRAARAP